MLITLLAPHCYGNHLISGGCADHLWFVWHFAYLYLLVRNEGGSQRKTLRSMYEPTTNSNKLRHPAEKGNAGYVSEIGHCQCQDQFT